MSFRQRDAKPYSYDYARLWALKARKRRFEDGAILLPPAIKEEKDELRPVVQEVKEQKPEKLYRGKRIGIINAGIVGVFMFGVGGLAGLSVNVVGGIVLLANAALLAGITVIAAALTMKDYGKE